MEKPKDSAEASLDVLDEANLNLAGTREPHRRGHATLADVEKLCADSAAQFGQKADWRPSNRQGELFDFIRKPQARKAAGILSKAKAVWHTSIAPHQARQAVKIPAVAVHIRSICAREGFRHHGFTATAALGLLAGFGIDGDRPVRIGVKA